MNRSTSLYLDLVRPFAAFVVLLSHLSSEHLTGGQLVPLERFGGQAVDVFFVLSGFVIAYVAATREKDARQYFLSRAARIYSVAFPALLLTTVLDMAGEAWRPEVYRQGVEPFTYAGLVRAVLFLGEFWNTNRFPGSNGPYWSLGFEVWYYAAFGAFLFAPRRWRWVAMLAVLAFIGPKVAILFPLWLLGVAAYHVCAGGRVSRRLGWVLLVASLVLFGGYELVAPVPPPAFMRFEFSLQKLGGVAQDYLVGGLFALHLLGFFAVSAAFRSRLELHAAAIRRISSVTFSLYLVHLPVLYFLAACSPWPATSLPHLALLLVGSVVTCVLFALVFERSKEFWHRALAAGLRATRVTGQCAVAWLRQAAIRDA